MGMFGKDDSLYLSRDAALPYRILLAHILGERYLPGGIMTLEEEEARELISLIESAADELPGCILFSDLLNRLSVYEFTPPGNAERLLTAVTVKRASAFADLSRRLAASLTELLASGGALTYLDTPN